MNALNTARIVLHSRFPRGRNVRFMSSRNILAAASAVLVVNSVYLAAFATPSLFYFTNVALHVGLGAVTFVLALVWLKRRATRIPASWMPAAALLAVGSLLGAALVVTGNTTRFRPLLLAHIACMTAGTVVAIALAAAAALRARPQWRVRPLQLFYGLAVIALTGWSSTVVGRQALEERAPRRIVNPLTAPETMQGEGAGPKSPFFPS